MFEDFFTTYSMVEPPKVYKDNPDLAIRDIEESNITKYPMVTTIDNPTMVTDIQDYPGVFSPFDILVEEPLRKPEITTVNNKAIDVVNLARLFLNKPYVWGVADPDKGFDCSGLINYVYKLIGVDLPRTSHAMGKIGTEVQLSEVQPGDIIYTSSKGPSGGHVKMVSSVSNGLISVIEAKGKKWGIVESPLTNTSNIKSIRRVLDVPIAEAKPTGTGKFNDRQEFVTALNNTYREVLSEHGLDPNYSYILVALDAVESGWGMSLAGNFNYGGIKSKTGKKKKTFEYINGVKTPIYDSFRNFTSIRDYCNYKIDLLSNNRYNAFSTVPSSEPSKFIRHINDSGYSTSPSNFYVPYIMKIYKTVKGLS